RREVGVGRHVAAAGPDHLHVVHQTLPRAYEEKLKGIASAIAVVHHTGPLQRGPRGLIGLIAVAPIRRAAVIAARVDEFETAAAGVRPFAPAPALSVSHLIHGDVKGVGDKNATIGGNDVVGLGQRDPFTAARERTAVVAEDAGCTETGVFGYEACGVFGHHHVGIWRNGRALREVETDAAAHAPAG